MVQCEFVPHVFSPKPGIVLRNVTMEDTFAKVHYDKKNIYVEVFRLYIDEAAYEVI